MWVVIDQYYGSIKKVYGFQNETAARLFANTFADPSLVTVIETSKVPALEEEQHGDSRPGPHLPA